MSANETNHYSSRLGSNLNHKNNSSISGINSKLIINDYNYESSASSSSSASPNHHFGSDHHLNSINADDTTSATLSNIGSINSYQHHSSSSSSSTTSSSKQPFQTNYNQTGEQNNITNMMMLMNSYNTAAAVASGSNLSSFNCSMNNSSGLGDSMSLPCSMAMDGSNYSSSQASSYLMNTTGSMPATPTSPIKNSISQHQQHHQMNLGNSSHHINDQNSGIEDVSSSPSSSPSSSSSSSPSLLQNHSKINPNAPIFRHQQQQQQQNLNQLKSQSEMLNKLNSLSLSSGNGSAATSVSIQQLQKLLSVEKNNGNLIMNQQQVDYEPFNDYLGMDKMVTQLGANSLDSNTANSLLKSKLAGLNLNNIDPQQQQQLIAQAIAAAVASSSAAEYTQQLQQNQQNQQQLAKPINVPSRSMSENIELLNTKYQMSKNNSNNVSNNSNNTNNDQTNNGGNSGNSPHLNSLLATVAAAAANDSYMAFASNQIPVNMKRMSFPQPSSLSLSSVNANSVCQNSLLSPTASYNHSQQQQQHHQHHQSASSFMTSNRMNSNHNLFGSVNLNLLSNNSNEAQNLSNR